MHYGGRKDECRKYKESYMTIKSSGDEIPDNKELSPIDIKFLKQLYTPPMHPAQVQRFQNQIHHNDYIWKQTWSQNKYLIPYSPHPNAATQLGFQAIVLYG